MEARSQWPVARRQHTRVWLVRRVQRSDSLDPTRAERDGEAAAAAGAPRARVRGSGRVKLQCTWNAVDTVAADALGAAAIEREAEVRRLVHVQRDPLARRVARLAQHQARSVEGAGNAAEEVTRSEVDRIHVGDGGGPR